MSPRNSVTEIPPAPPDVALSHFTRLLAVETDCWDVHECLANDPGFVLLDVRGPEAYAAGHVAQAVLKRIEAKLLESDSLATDDAARATMGLATAPEDGTTLAGLVQAARRGDGLVPPSSTDRPSSVH